MIEALWSAEFKIPNGSNFGSGIAVFENGKVLGGDSSFTWIGNYDIKDGVISGPLRIKRYSHSIQLPSISGLDDYVLDVVGNINAERMELSGTSKQIPGFQLNIELIRRAELP